MRSTTPCDGCALRRVRCKGGYPCGECQRRSLACTFLRVPKKRGPKGPRLATGCRIKTFQRNLENANLPNPPNPPSPPNPPNHGLHPKSTWTHQQPPATAASLELLTHSLGPVLESCLHQIPLSAYLEFLEIFRRRLYPVWPIVSYDDLMSRLRADDHDFEAYALADALCAAVIAQLRLPEHEVSFAPISSRHFEIESRQMRNLFDYGEDYSMASLLTSFFLQATNGWALLARSNHLRARPRAASDRSICVS